MDRPVYITGVGKYLPGDPVSNDEVEERLGRIGGRPSRAKRRILESNGIQTRHYALDPERRPTHRNWELAARAAQDALARSPAGLADVRYLAAATSQPDLLVPGFASMVHGELKVPPCEIASYAGVCASGVMALKGAWLQVRAGEAEAAVVAASELASRHLKAGQFEEQECTKDGTLPFEAEFLRWMLSDGAGAVVLQPAPAPRGVSLRIDWIEVRSFADRFPPCMWAGALKGADGALGPSWGDWSSFVDAARHGVFDLRQDVRLLEELVKVGVDGFLDLAERRALAPSSIDWVLCHYSSNIFKGKIQALLARAGVAIPEARWFSNLTTRGNVGAASIYLMLEELVASGRARPGQKVLLVVPESGRFVTCFALLTVVGEAAPAPAISVPEAAAPQVDAGASPEVQALVRRLSRVWIDFETGLNQVPIVDKLNRGQVTLADYRLLLRELRQQVVDGSRWIARAVSSMGDGLLPLRSLFLRHARDEHKDFELLERNYVSVGGALEEVRGCRKNVGSEALSAWMFHRASQPDPLDLLGAMFIIEGLGTRLAARWAKQLQQQLDLQPEQVSFLRYHGENDADHFAKLEAALGAGLVTEALADRIVRTAQVTARLYRLQLEELGRG